MLSSSGGGAVAAAAVEDALGRAAEVGSVGEGSSVAVP